MLEPIFIVHVKGVHAGGAPRKGVRAVNVCARGVGAVGAHVGVGYSRGGPVVEGCATGVVGAGGDHDMRLRGVHVMGVHAVEVHARVHVRVHARVHARVHVKGFHSGRVRDRDVDGVKVIVVGNCDRAGALSPGALPLRALPLGALPLEAVSS